MRKVRNILISLAVMGIVSVLSLLVVSTLAYLFKWQADNAMIGIIATYIIAGFAGGVCMKCLGKRQYNMKQGIGSKAIEALIVSNAFMMILLIVSVFALQNSFEVSGRLLMIWALLMSSTFLGRIL